MAEGVLTNQFNNINKSTVTGVDLTSKKFVNVEDKHKGHED